MRRAHRGIFIDTGALIARVSPGDQFEAATLRGWGLLQANAAIPLFSSEPVLIEAANFLTRSQGGAFAAEWVRHHLDSSEIRWLQPAPEDLRAAACDMTRFADQRITYTDALSFALMRRFQIQTAFGFDRHFTHAGFELWAGSD